MIDRFQRSCKFERESDFAVVVRFVFRLWIVIQIYSLLEIGIAIHQDMHNLGDALGIELPYHE